MGTRRPVSERGTAARHSHSGIDFADLHVGYGAAYEDVREDEDGSLWIGNGEYSAPVNFCPVCGYEAKTKIPMTENGEIVVVESQPA